MKVKNDHRSKFSNLSNWKEEAWKKSGLQRELFHILHISEKNAGFSTINSLVLSVTVSKYLKKKNHLFPRRSKVFIPFPDGEDSWSKAQSCDIEYRQLPIL